MFMYIIAKRNTTKLVKLSSSSVFGIAFIKVLIADLRLLFTAMNLKGLKSLTDLSDEKIERLLTNVSIEIKTIKKSRQFQGERM